MCLLARALKTFLASDDAATAAEYAVMLILMAGASIAVIATLGRVTDGQVWTSRAY